LYIPVKQFWSSLVSAVEVYIPFAEVNDTAVGYRKTFNSKLWLRGFVASRHMGKQRTL